MGYGHQRAVYPLRAVAEDGIITVGSEHAASKTKKNYGSVFSTDMNLFHGQRNSSNWRSSFNLFDTFMQIPSPYPMRDLSNKTLQVAILESSINKVMFRNARDYKD